MSLPNYQSSKQRQKYRLATMQQDRYETAQYYCTPHIYPEMMHYGSSDITHILCSNTADSSYQAHGKETTKICYRHTPTYIISSYTNSELCSAWNIFIITITILRQTQHTPKDCEHAAPLAIGGRYKTWRNFAKSTPITNKV